MTFKEWLKEIDIFAKVNGHIGNSYTNATGHQYWQAAFDAGLTSEEAFNADASMIETSDEIVEHYPEILQE